MLMVLVSCGSKNSGAPVYENLDAVYLSGPWTRTDLTGKTTAITISQFSVQVDTTITGNTTSVTYPAEAHMKAALSVEVDSQDRVWYFSYYAFHDTMEICIPGPTPTTTTGESNHECHNYSR